MKNNFILNLKTLILLNLTFLSLAGFSQTTYYLKTASQANANVVSNWTTDNTGGGGGTAATVFTNAVDTWVILSSQTAVFANGTSTTFAGTLQVDGLMQIANNPANNISTTVTVNGTIIFSIAGSSQLTLSNGGGSGSTSFVLGNSALLKTKNTAGVFGTACSIAAIGNKSTVTLPITSNYEFNGTGQSTTGLPATVNNCTFSGAGTNTLSAALTVNGTLTLTGGIITTGANVLKAAGTISGGSSANYVSGKLARTISTTTPTTFPIGKGGNYRPVVFTYATAPGSKTVTVEQFESAYPGTIPANISTARFGSRYWNITQSATGTAYNIGLNNGGVTPAGSVSIIRREGTGGTTSNSTTFSSPNYTNSTVFTTTNASNDLALGETNIPLTITGVTVSNRPYNGTAVATLNTASAVLSGVVSGDAVTLNSGSATGTFADPNVGTGKVVTTAGFTISGANATAYTLSQPTTTANITAAALSITATAATKVYGQTFPVGAGSTAFTSTGLQNGETIGSITIASTGAISTAPATNYLIVPSAATGGTFTAANYTITYTNGVLTVTKAPLTITGIAVNNKPYDGTTTATLTGTAAYAGLQNSESFTVTGTPVANFNNANVGTGKPVTVIGYTAPSTNYTISQPTGLTADILATAISVADFHSRQSGSFKDPNTWEYNPDGTWVTATQAPLSTNKVDIINGHAIVLDSNFTVGTGKTFIISSGTLDIDPTHMIDVAAGGTLDFNGQLVTVKSDVTGTGSIGTIAATATLSGATNVTAERFIGNNNKRAWRLLTIPVTGQTIREAWAGAPANPDATPTNLEIPGTGTLITGPGYSDGTAAASAGFDWFTGLSAATTSSIRSYNATSNGWPSATNTPAPNSLPAEQGYMLYVRGDRTIADATSSGTTTLRPNGTLNQGNKTTTIANAFAVVGNPYAASIDLDAVYNNTGNSAVINRNFWVWDASQGTSGAYRVLSWNNVNGYDLGNGDDGTPYLTVNSGQAFFVQQNGGGTTLTIQENNKTSVTPLALFRPMSPAGTGVSKLGIKLFEAVGNILGREADGALARYNDIYNVAPTENVDAVKLNSFNENISLVRNNRYLSIESRPFPTQSDTLFVPFWNLKVRDYALSIASSNFAGINQTAVLIDRFTNTQKVIDLSNGTITYPFSITSNPASSSLNRFLIVLSPSAPLAVKFTKINALPAGNNVMVNWSVGSEQGVKNYEVEKSTDGAHFTKSGTILANGLTAGANYQWADDQVAEGNNYYRIRSNEESGTFSYSSVVMVQWKAKKGIQVYPTLITNKQFTLSLSNQPLGNYIVSLTDASGQQVFIKTITNAGGNNKQVITLNKAAVPAGVYNLSVSNETGIKQNFRIAFN